MLTKLLGIIQAIAINRATQWLTRSLAVAFAYLAGKGLLPGGYEQTLTSTLIEIAIVLILFGFDAIVHSKLFVRAEDFLSGAQQKTSGNGGGVGGGITALLLVASLWAVGAGTIASMAACAQTETNRAAQAMIATKTHAEIALSLHNAHVTTPAQEQTITDLLDDERNAVKAYYAAILAGDSGALAIAKASLAAASKALDKELAKYQLPPSTQPAP